MVTSTLDLQKLAQKYNINLPISNIVTKDKIREAIDYETNNKQFFIINLDSMDANFSGGTHWVALYINAKKSIAYYFDSFGIQPPEEIKNIFEIIGYNTFQVQKIKSTLCGEYCIQFLNALKHKDTLETYENFINLFEDIKNR